jgi:hypothetical protein
VRTGDGGEVGAGHARVLMPTEEWTSQGIRSRTKRIT